MFLELNDVRVNYGGARILRGISMHLKEGDIVCLIGANGAGKTTTLRTISGLKRPAHGEIMFKGKDISRTPPQDILAQGIAHVPQEGRVFKEMTVYQNLSMGAYLRKDRSKINADLEVVYDYFPVLRTRSKQKAGRLSGGERQILAIGRALMCKPDVLIMDEPTLGLAPIMVKLVGEIIFKLNADGLSIVLVEQNADLALNISRYGYVMERGKIALEGETRELLSNDLVREAYLGI
jgi:branched-chain amino acid transport system ATP-binding protein